LSLDHGMPGEDRPEEAAGAAAPGRCKEEVGWLMGFEPTTTGITIRDSTAELQPPSKTSAGAPDRTRTCYPRLRRPVLYPNELRAQTEPSRATKSGRGGGIRTPDNLLPKQVRYQAALHPVGYCQGEGELYAAPVPGPTTRGVRPGARYCAGAPPSPAGAATGSSRRAGASSSALRDRRTRPLSSASSTFTFTIWPSLR
jgi:hypothetical protein